MKLVEAIRGGVNIIKSACRYLKDIILLEKDVIRLIIRIIIAI